jgi:hypothetical protein
MLSLADSVLSRFEQPHAMTVWTISTIPTFAQTTTSILTQSTHISTDGRPQHSHKETSQTQHHKGWKTSMTLMTAWLSNTNQVWTQILKVWGLGNNIKACIPICELEREKAHKINMVKGHLPCSPNCCCSKSWMSSPWRFSKSSAPNDSNRKQVIQANK